jgi:hypothetical protein
MTNLVSSSLLLLLPPSLLAGAVTAIAEKDSDPMSKVIEVGIGGLVVFLVTAPLMRWVLKRLDAQQKQNERLIETLASAVRVGQRDSAQHARVQDEMLEELRALRIDLRALPERVVDHLRANGKPGG